MEIIGTIIQSFLIGIPQGALYGLFGFGMALIFSSATVMNFAHGHAGMIGVWMAFTVHAYTNSLPLAILAGIVSGFILGYLIEKFLMRPIKHVSHFGLLIITLGLILIFQDTALFVFGEDQQQFPEIFIGNPLFITIGDYPIVVPSNDIVITAIAIVLALALAFFLSRAKFGIGMRARAQDEVGAKVVGINTNTIDAVAWAVGIAVSVLVGILAAPKTTVHPEMMTGILLFGITACVLGGFSNPFGAVLGGLVLGVIEQIANNYIPAQYQLSVIFGLVILLLAFKPEGIFSRELKTRA